MKQAETYDVVVVGGGAAGFAAALSAARAGARTALAERSGSLGGVVASALVHTICGLYAPSQAGEPEHVHEGLPRAFAELLRARGGAGNVTRARDAAFLPIEPAAFVALADVLCAAREGLDVLRRHTLSAAVLACEPGDLSEVVVAGPDGHRALRARAVIDTSGDASAAHLGGARTMQAGPAVLQHPSYIFRLEGVRTNAFDTLECARAGAAVAHAAKHGELPIAAESVLLRVGIDGDAVYVTLNLDKPADDTFDPLDEHCLAAMLESARGTATAIASFLVSRRRAFAGAHLGACADRLGVRESRRVEGIDILGADAVLEGRRRDDEVCRSSWPIELWTSHRRLDFQRVAAPCSVPLGALVSKSHPRLAMAGRCVSAAHDALGAVRVIATSMATGEAAGLCAAAAVDAGTALCDVDPTRVRARAAEAVWRP